MFLINFLNMDKTIKGYIYHAISYETPYNDTINDNDETVNCVDIFYVNIDDKLNSITNDIERNKYIVNNCLSCLRIYNFFVSFYIVKLPGMNSSEFKSFILSNTKYIKDVEIKFKTTFRNKPFIESSFFNFNKPTLYAKIKAKSSTILKKCHTKLKTAIKSHYDKIKNKEIELNNWDKLFYDNTESPFRNDMTTLLASNVRYYLSTKYNIPCAGGFIFSYDDKQVRTFDSFPINEYPGHKFMSIFNRDNDKEYKTLFIDMNKQNKIFHQIKHDDNINGQQYLTLMSYDIETYESNLRKLEESEKIIMCIGIGLFNITNDKPFMRYCLSIKDFTDEDIKSLGHKYIEQDNEQAKQNDNDNKQQQTTTKRYKNKIVSNEYTDLYNKPMVQDRTQDDNDIINNNDFTNYIICDNEKDMLKMFIKLIGMYRPTFITGFNNYGFDDRRIYDRMKYYNIHNINNSILQYYDLSYMSNKNKKINIPKQFDITPDKFSIKIDGEMYNDNITWIGETKSFIVDVYKIMLASNAKLYTQQGRGNLDTMLTVNNINNPFNNKPLQKSGLSYNQMWYNWDNNKNIYDIMLYCCQDAWICGTLLIKSCQLIDKIEMSTLSATTISDSIYKAVTWRVKHLIEQYAYNNNFAVTDSIINTTDKNKQHISRADNHTLGNKRFDTRQIVGGEVKNVISGKTNYVIALDFSAMYPSQKEGSNIDTSSIIPDDIINDPVKYGLNKYHDDINIYDMYKQRKIVYLENKHNDKFIVEQFQSVFKNNIDEIKKTLEAMEVDKSNKSINKQSLINNLKKLQPNNYKDLTDNIYKYDLLTNDIIKDIPPTETKYLFAVQSPRDENNIISTHYSLKEIMLSDLRALRSKVKKQMEAATNPIDRSRYNSKQLAIKVMCNSEYGASNSSYFPYYDPLIGGATTAASRCLINFLTNLIQANKLYVNEQFMKENEKYIKHLQEYDVLTWKQTKITDNKQFVNNCRRFALRQMFDEYYNIIESNIYELTIKPSMVVYQDTDSNYYTNDYIKSLFSPIDNDRQKHLNTYYNFVINNYNYCLQFDNFDDYYKWIISRDNNYEDPTMINLKMNLLLSHNNLVGNFIKYAIYRKPVTVAFEGAFTIVRYFNVKKKYYGHVWNDRMSYTLPTEYYNENILSQNYNIQIGKSCFPMLNGDYINIDEHKLLSTETDKLAYIKKQNIKLTGVDLARRDQYKFININHIRLIQQDLHFLKYDNNNNWVNISNVNIYDIVINLLNKFKQQFIDIDNIINNMKNNIDGDYDISKFYSLNDYTKDVSFKYTKANFLVCKTRTYINTDKKYEYERYVINDLNERTDDGLYKSECKAYSTTDGTLILTLLRDNDGNYKYIYSKEYGHIESNISPEYNALFYLSKVDNEDKNKDEYYIDYDCVNWDKKGKTMITIGNRLYKTLQNIKDETHTRLTDKTFSDNFPSGFSRKQYVIYLTEATKADRLKGVKTETVKNSDKAYLVEELRNKYQQKLTIEEYNKLLYHNNINYEQFIDLLIINDLDHIHYMEAFINAISLYLIEYAKDILPTKDYNTIKHLIPNGMIDNEDDNDNEDDDDNKKNNNKSIMDIKKLISWKLLTTIYPDRIRAKPRIKKIKQINEKLYINDLTPDQYKQILLSNDENIINNWNNKHVNIPEKFIYIVEDSELEELKEYETEYNKKYKNIINHIYKRYCDIKSFVPWRTVINHVNLILIPIVNYYTKLNYKINSLKTLEEYYNNDIIPDIEIYKLTANYIDINFFRKLYNKTISKDEHKKIIDDEYNKLNKSMKQYNELIIMLSNIKIIIDLRR